MRNSSSLSCAQLAALAQLLRAPGGALPIADVWAAMQGHGTDRPRIPRAASRLALRGLVVSHRTSLDTPEPTFTITAEGRATILKHLLPAVDATHVSHAYRANGANRSSRTHRTPRAPRVANA